MSAKPEEFTLNQLKNELNGILRSMPEASSPGLQFINATYLAGKTIDHLRLEQEFNVTSRVHYEALIKGLRQCGIEAEFSPSPNANMLRIIIKKNPGKDHFEKNKEAIKQIFKQHFQPPALAVSTAQASTPSMSSAQAIASSPSPSAPVKTPLADTALASHQAQIESIRATLSLHLAAQDGSLKKVKGILENGREELRAAINASRLPARFAKGSPGDNIFHTAVRRGDSKQLRNLLAYPRPGEDRTLVNQKNWLGETPVQLAIKTMDFSVAEFFYQSIKMQNENKSDVVISATDDEYRCLKAMHIFYHSINQQDENGNTSLHLAVENVQADVVNYLLEPNPKPLINAVIQNKDGNIPLHLAVRNGQLEIAKKLIDHLVISANTQNNDGDTPVHLAVRHGQLEIVEYLKNAKALFLKWARENPEIFASDVKRALRLAELNRRPRMAEELRLARESNNLERLIELLGYEIDVYRKNKKGETPLHLAVCSNSLTMVNHLIELGADLEAKNNAGDTLLHLAVMYADMNMVNYLIELGADLEAKNENGDTPLHLAVMNKEPEIAKELVERLALGVSGRVIKPDARKVLKPDARNVGGNTPLHLAIELKNIKIAKILRGADANLNLPNDAGDTPLHLAIKNEAYDIVKFLIKHVDLTLVNSDGLTALQLAMIKGDLQLIEIFMEEMRIREKGKKEQGDESECKIPRFFLHLAAQHKQKKVIDYLVSQNENLVNERDLNGDTPLHLMASEMNDTEMAAYLIQKGANPNIQNNYGQTPLAFAVRARNLKMIRFLVEEIKVDMDVKDNQGNTLLALAIKTGDSDIINYFLENAPHLLAVPNKDGLTPFMAALKNNDIWLAEHLAYYGASYSENEDLRSSNMRPMPLSEREATERRYVPSTTVAYKELKAYVVARDRLFDAFNRGDWNEFNRILSSHNPEHKIDINIRNQNGDTLLHIALRSGNTKGASSLMERGANLHIRNRQGDTPYILIQKKISSLQSTQQPQPAAPVVAAAPQATATPVVAAAQTMTPQATATPVVAAAQTMAPQATAIPVVAAAQTMAPQSTATPVVAATQYGVQQPTTSPAFFQPPVTTPLPVSQQTQAQRQILAQVFAENPLLKECFRIECSGDQIKIRESAGHKQRLVDQHRDPALYTAPLREWQFLGDLLNSRGINFTRIPESESPPMIVTMANGSQQLVPVISISLSFPAPNPGQKPPEQFTPR